MLTGVTRVDVRSEEVRVLGLHEKAVSTVVYAPEQSTTARMSRRPPR
jgi:hypothetical protein